MHPHVDFSLSRVGQIGTRLDGLHTAPNELKTAQNFSTREIYSGDFNHNWSFHRNLIRRHWIGVEFNVKKF